MQAKLKNCDGPCNKPKRIWKNHEGKRYCQDCWNKVKPTVPTSKTAPSSFKPIAKESDKRKKEHVLYSAARLVYLKQHPFCEMNIAGLCTTKATTVQHKKGRGKYYLDQRYWMPACWPCHQYADTHPQEAIENDWAIARIPDEKEI